MAGDGASLAFLLLLSPGGEAADFVSLKNGQVFFHNGGVNFIRHRSGPMRRLAFRLLRWRNEASVLGKFGGVNFCLRGGGTAYRRKSGKCMANWPWGTKAVKLENGKNKFNKNEKFWRGAKNSKYTPAGCRTDAANLVGYQVVGSSADHRVDLGAKIRKYRMRAGLSQEAVAGKAEIHRNYFGRVERGEASITIKKLRRVADVLGVRFRVLVWNL